MKLFNLSIEFPWSNVKAQVREISQHPQELSWGWKSWRFPQYGEPLDFFGRQVATLAQDFSPSSVIKLLEEPQYKLINCMLFWASSWLSLLKPLSKDEVQDRNLVAEEKFQLLSFNASYLWPLHWIIHPSTLTDAKAIIAPTTGYRQCPHLLYTPWAIWPSLNASQLR